MTAALPSFSLAPRWPQSPAVLSLSLLCLCWRTPLPGSRLLPALLPCCSQLVERANTWAARLGCEQDVQFVYSNATISLATMLSSYPGADAEIRRFLTAVIRGVAAVMVAVMAAMIRGVAAVMAAVVSGLTLQLCRQLRRPGW